MNGFVKLHRKLVQWGWYTDNVVKGVFLHFLLTAAYEECEYMGTSLKPGELIIKVDQTAKELGFTTQNVRTAIKKLCSTGEILKNSTNKNTRITIVNWEDYQVFNNLLTNEQQTTNKQLTNNQQTTNKRLHIIRNKEDKKLRNKEVFSFFPCTDLSLLIEDDQEFIVGTYNDVELVMKMKEYEKICESVKSKKLNHYFTVCCQQIEKGRLKKTPFEFIMQMAKKDGQIEDECYED